MTKKLIVAVDGPAGSGKSSVSKIVALKTHLKYIDSGALYRTITYSCLQKFGVLSSEIDLEKELLECEIKQVFNSDATVTSFLNGVDVSEDIRTEKIAKNIGIVSDDIKVRNFVNNLLRSWSAEDSIIMDGRDIGTVVFPDADIKIYLDASVEERAKRRHQEYIEKGKKVDLNEIKNQIILRDNQDRGRPFGALKKADDALVLDTSSMSKDEVIDAFVSIIIDK